MLYSTHWRIHNAASTLAFLVIHQRDVYTAVFTTDDYTKKKRAMEAVLDLQQQQPPPHIENARLPNPRFLLDRQRRRIVGAESDRRDIVEVQSRTLTEYVNAP